MKLYMPRQTEHLVGLVREQLNGQLISVFQVQHKIAYVAIASKDAYFTCRYLEVVDVMDFEALELQQVAEGHRILFGTGGTYFYSEPFESGYQNAFVGVIFPDFGSDFFCEVPYDF